MKSAISQLLKWCASAAVLVLATQAVPAKPVIDKKTQGGCNLYPIALSMSSVSNIATGTVLSNLKNGAKNGDFGWLTWSGNRSRDALVSSLTTPGDSYTYVNPANSGDSQLSTHNWVKATGSDKAKPVRDALDKLKNKEIVVPLWYQVLNSKDKGAYRVGGFAKVQLLDYNLDNTDKISVRYLGTVNCDHGNDAPLVSAGPDQVIAYPSRATLNGSATDDGLPAGGTLTCTWSKVSGPGTVIFSAPHAATTVASFTDPGAYVLRLSATDSAKSSSADVTVTVNYANAAPVADSQTLKTDEDVPVNVTLTGSDPDGDPVSFVIMSNPSFGGLSGTAPNLVYTPAANVSGMDTFSFKVNDGVLDSPVATVTIEVAPVNDPPVAYAQSVTTDEDTAVAVTLGGSDVEGTALTFTVLTQPAHGVLSGAGANLVYTPAADYFGSDKFTFKVDDGALSSPPATVTITVRPVNDPPIAFGDSASLDEDGALDLVLRGSDPEGSALSFVIVAPPAHGVLSGTPPNVRYVPAANYNGGDSFRFKVNDGALDSAPAVVTLTVRAVNDAPVALADSVALNEDSSADILLRGTDVEGSPLTFTIMTPPAHGALSGTPPNVRYTPAANYNGPDIFTFKVNDGSLDSVPATVTLTVRPVNDAPVAEDDSVVLDEDGFADVVLRGSDVEGSPLTFSIVTPPAHGALSGTPPNVRYVPAANYNGPDSFTFKVNDGALDSALARVSLTVRAVNDAPVAVDASVSLDEDSSADIVLRGSDVEGSPLTFSIVTPPTHGSLSGTLPSVRYVPAANYNGPDSFTFKVNDGALDSAPATVNLNVLPVNDAPVAENDSVVLDEDGSADLVLRASDVEGSPLTFSIVTPPTHGVLSGTLPNVRYVPAANFYGADSFRFKVNDGSLDSAVAVVTITVRPVNDAPVAFDLSASLDEDTSADLVLRGSDVEGSALTFSVVNPPSHGALSGTPPALHYVPTANYNGPDSFTFKVNDGELDSALATVSLTVLPVNDAPVAADLSVSLDEDTMADIVLTGSDVERSPLTFILVNPPAHGSLSGAPPNVRYTPAANYNGPDSFTYKVNDGELDSPVATVSLTVLAVNDAPVAFNASASLDEDSSADLVLRGSDVEGSALTFSIVAPPSHGVLSGTPPAVHYVPAANYNGPDRFTFKVNDGELDSAVATVTLTILPVNDAPVASDLSVSLDEDMAADVVLTGSDVEGSPLTFVLVNPPAHGSLSGAPPNVRYTPAPNYNGPDSFSFQVNDGELDSAVATVSLTVRPVNDAPVALDASVSLDEDTSTDLVLRGTDVEGSALTFLVVNPPSHGVLSGTPPAVHYVPAANYNGPDRFTFKVNDGELDSAVATVTLTILPVNDAPVASDLSVSLDEDMAADVVLTGSDVEGSPLTFVLVNPPAHGSLSGAPPNVRYTPAANYNGPDVFTFKVNDGALDSGVATVSLTVRAVNDVPVALDDSVALDEDTSVEVLLRGSDVEGSALTFSIVNPPAHGALIGTSPTVRYVPSANYYGPDSFTFKVSDGELNSATATVSINVRPVDDVPVADSAEITLDEDTVSDIVLTGSDVEGSSLTYTVVDFPMHGVLSGTAPNVSYTPDANYYGRDSFSFRVNDGALDSELATVSLTVNSVNDVPVTPSQDITTAEDTAVSVTLTASDVDGDPLTFVVVNGPAHGTLSGTPPNLTYTPAANYYGVDSFQFVANDGMVDSALATVWFTVTPVNDAPVALAQSVSTLEDTPLALTLSGTDVENSELTYVIVTPPAHGTLSGVVPDLFYAPRANYNGADSFSFRVYDGELNSAPAVVSITVIPVNDAPVADDQHVRAVELESTPITLTASDVDGDTLTYQIVSGPSNGTLSGVAPNLSYTPNAQGHPTADTFTFTVSDGVAVSSLATVTIDIIYNQPPVVNAGPDQVLRSVTDVAMLSGSATDDGLPRNSTLQVSWSMKFGPGTVTFGNGSSAVTSATFSTSGLYILELSASDSQFTSRDLVEVRVGMICSANPSGVVAWWPADFKTADIISGNEAVMENGADYGTGKVGAAFVFDGVDDRLHVPPSASLDIGAANSFTIEFWMNSADVMRATRLVGWHSGIDVFVEDMGVNVFQSGGELHAQVYDTNSISHEMVAFNALTNNLWTHVAVTYDRATGQGKIYVNGALRTISNLGNFRPRTTFPLFFGNILQDSTYFRGALDEITLYTRALDAQEIYEVFAANGTGKCQPTANQPPVVNAGPDLGLANVSDVALLRGSATDDGLPAPASLRAAWSVVSGPGTVAFSDPAALTTSATFNVPGVYVLRLSVDDAAIVRSDVVEVRVATLCTIKSPTGLVAWWPGNGTGADLIGGREARLGGGTAYAAGQVGAAFSFDGVNDCARAAGDAALDVGTGNGFTMEFWMNSADVNRIARLVAFHSGLAANGTNVGVNVFQLSGEVHAQVPDFAGNTHEFVALNALTANTWTHVAVTYDRVRGLGRIYINGVQRVVSNQGSFLSRTAYPVHFGNMPFDANYYKGMLDEVSVYNRALDSQAVYDLFSAGSAGKCPNDLNQPPVVNAGPDLYVRDAAQAVNLVGTVSDDGLPPGSVLRSLWSVVDGPGSVTFGDATAAATSVLFSAPGTYVLQLTANDGVIASSDTVEVRVGTLCTVKDIPGLVAWWPGNGNANDIVSGNNGRLAGGVGFGSAKVSAGFRFDGSNDVVQVAANPSLDVGQGNGLALEFWINSTDVTRFTRVVGWHYGMGSGATNFGVNVYQQSGGLSAQIYDLAGTSHEFGAFNILLSNVWTHVAVTYDRTTGQGRIYINGALKTTSALGVFTPRTTSNFYLGNFPSDTGFFRGMLDEVSIYNRVLDAQDVYDIYNSGATGKCPKDLNQAPVVNAGPNLTLAAVSDIASLNGQVSDDGMPVGAGLRVTWSKVDGPGTVNFGNANTAVTSASFSAPGVYLLSLMADDAAIVRSDLVEVRVAMPCTSTPIGLVAWWPGNGNAQEVMGGLDGRLAGGVSFASGRVSQAFSFDGSNDVVQVPTSAALDVGQGAGLSVEFWMNPADVTRNGRMVGWHSGLAAGGTNFGVNVQMLGTLLNAQIYDLAGASHDINLGNVLTNNTWAHVAVTYDRSAGQGRIYLNGILRSTVAVGSYTPRTGYKLFFGNVPFDTSFYRGLLDEVSIYDHALTSNEVASVYAAGAAGKCPPAPVAPMFAQEVAMPEDMATITENQNGQRVSMTDASGTTTYSYDAAGRVSRISKSWSAYAGAPAMETELVYDYDDLGRFVGVHSTSVNGAAMNYLWSDGNQLLEVVDPHSGHTVYHYDANGKAVSYTYPNNVTGSGFGVLDNVGCYDEAAATVVCDADGHRVRRTVTVDSRTITTYYVVSPLTVTGAAQLVEELTFDSGDPMFAAPAVTRVYVHGIHTISQEELANGVWNLTFFE